MARMCGVLAWVLMLWCTTSWLAGYGPKTFGRVDAAVSCGQGKLNVRIFSAMYGKNCLYYLSYMGKLFIICSWLRHGSVTPATSS